MILLLLFHAIISCHASVRQFTTPEQSRCYACSLVLYMLVEEMLLLYMLPECWFHRCFPPLCRLIAIFLHYAACKAAPPALFEPLCLALRLTRTYHFQRKPHDKHHTFACFFFLCFQLRYRRHADDAVTLPFIFFATPSDIAQFSFSFTLDIVSLFIFAFPVFIYIE